MSPPDGSAPPDRDPRLSGPVWRHPGGRAVPAAFLALWTCVALALLTGFEPLWFLAGAITLAMALLGGWRNSGFPRRALVAFGGAALVLTGIAGDWQAAAEAVRGASVLVGFLASLYLLRSLIESAATLPRVLSSFAGLGIGERRGVVYLLTWVLALPLAIGSTSVVVPLVRQESDPDRRVDLAAWSMRGVALTVVYSPFTIAMAVVTSIVAGLDLHLLIGVGFLYSVILLALPFALRRCRLPRRLDPGFWPAALAVMTPVALLVATNTSTILLTPLTPAEAGLLVIPACMVLVGLHGGSARRSVMISRTADSLRGYDAETAVFVSALLFAAAIRMTTGIVDVVDGLTADVGPVWLILLTAVAIPITTVLGLHMVVTTSILLGLFAPAMPDATHTTLLALAALTGWAFGGTCGVGAISFLACARMFGVPPRKLALSHNLRFFVGVYVVLAAILLLLA